MFYVGVDLHKQSISLCVVELAGRERKIIERRRFRCDEEESMADYFVELGEYQLSSAGAIASSVPAGAGIRPTYGTRAPPPYLSCLSLWKAVALSGSPVNSAQQTSVAKHQKRLHCLGSSCFAIYPFRRTSALAALCLAMSRRRAF